MHDPHGAESSSSHMREASPLTLDAFAAKRIRQLEHEGAQKDTLISTLQRENELLREQLDALRRARHEQQQTDQDQVALHEVSVIQRVDESELPLKVMNTAGGRVEEEGGLAHASPNSDNFSLPHASEADTGGDTEALQLRQQTLERQMKREKARQVAAARGRCDVVESHVGPSASPRSPTSLEREEDTAGVRKATDYVTSRNTLMASSVAPSCVSSGASTGRGDGLRDALLATSCRESASALSYASSLSYTPQNKVARTAPHGVTYYPAELCGPTTSARPPTHAVQTFQVPDATQLVKSSASRRAERRQRLRDVMEKAPGPAFLQEVSHAAAEACTSGSLPPYLSPEAIASGPTVSGPVCTGDMWKTSWDVRRDEYGAGCASPVRRVRNGCRGAASKKAEEEEQWTAATAVRVNPNQMGEALDGQRKDRQWFLHCVLREGFLKMIQPVTMHDDPVAAHPAGDRVQGSSFHTPSTTAAARVSSEKEAPLSIWNGCQTDAISDGGGCPLSAGGRIAVTVSAQSSESQVRAEHMATLSESLEHTEASSKSGDGGSSSGIHLYEGGVPSAALQRAIEESIPLYFRCAGNGPLLIPSATYSGKTPSAVPPFEAENSDPDLLRAFAPTREGSGTPTRKSADTTAKGGEGVLSTPISSAPLQCSAPRTDEVRLVFHAPVIFSQIRSFLRMDTVAFRRMLEQRATWRYSASPGKSGTVLYYFGDYVMKSLKLSELSFLTKKFLPQYVQYCERNGNTRLTRFYALVTVQWIQSGETQHFVLMQNVFSTRYYIKRIFDVKGSTVGRSAVVAGKPLQRTAFGALLLKDNDLPEQLIICGQHQRELLLSQLRSDIVFLESLYIVDYSCMIGVRSRVFAKDENRTCAVVRRRSSAHREVETEAACRDALDEPDIHSGRRTDSNLSESVGSAPINGTRGITQASAPSPALATSYAERSCSTVRSDVYGSDGGLISLPICEEDDDTTVREEVYYIGIIDVLQVYTSAKRLESFAKGFMSDRKQISVIRPKDYADRLYRVLERITV